MLCITATVKVNKIFANDQVSFGLMVRDDCYIDKNMPDILGDYVAAAPLFITKGEKATATFARRSGQLVLGKDTNEVIKEGGEYELMLSSSSDGYAAKFGKGDVITGGYDFKLTAIDPAHVYVGMFVSRNADVIFSNIKYTKNE